ncbi:MAG: IS3 family transposase [Patescibacteria group bacterium]|nr:IS3 family transposase [Patescibacteria group bacterium]
MFGVNRICKLVGISKTTYYSATNPIERFEKKYINIKSFVRKVIKDNPGYGIRRIKAELEEKYHIQVGRDTLGKLLNLWGLSLKRKIKTKKPNMIQKILLALASRANLLIRTKLTKPMHALTSDITKLHYLGGKAYFCVHKDVFGQMVYGWSLGLSMETSLVMKSLKMAIAKIKKLTGKLKNKPILHQDRGSQYTSHQYVQAGLEFARLSYSNPGTPTHNPGQESFFGRFKDDWKDEIAEIETFEKLEKFVRNKIKYYNYERRHTSTGLISPWNFTKSFLKNRR